MIFTAPSTHGHNFYQLWKEADIIEVVKFGRFEPLQETDLYTTRRYKDERKTSSEMGWFDSMEQDTRVPGIKVWGLWFASMHKFNV